MKKHIYIFFTLLILSFPQLIYRFRHPEKTETQLMLSFFEAYHEFFKIK